MKEKKSKKNSSNQSSKKDTIIEDVLYAEAVNPNELLYNMIINTLIVLFILCLMYAIFDIAKEILIK